MAPTSNWRNPDHSRSAESDIRVSIGEWLRAILSELLAMGRRSDPSGGRRCTNFAKLTAALTCWLNLGCSGCKVSQRITRTTWSLCTSQQSRLLNALNSRSLSHRRRAHHGHRHHHPRPIRRERDGLAISGPANCAPCDH
jgi:hypothetical protein